MIDFAKVSKIIDFNLLINQHNKKYNKTEELKLQITMVMIHMAI